MRTPLSIPIVTAVLFLVLSGCGGRGALDATVADDLADRADAVADALAAGDGCAALDRVTELESATTAARESGEVTDTVAAEVLTVAQRISEAATCEPAPPVPSPDGDDDGDEQEEDDREDEDEEEGKDKEKDDDHPGRGKGRGNDDD